MAFHFNHYDIAARLAPLARVGLVATRFDRWLAGQNAEVADHRVDDNLEGLLTDLRTERLLSWCVLTPSALSNRVADMESMLRQDATEFDRPKLRMLLAEVAIAEGEHAEAKRHARELAHHPTFGRWAERVIGATQRTQPNE